MHVQIVDKDNCLCDHQYSEILAWYKADPLEVWYQNTYASNVNGCAKNSNINMHGPEKSLELIYIPIRGKGIKDVNLVHKPWLKS